MIGMGVYRLGALAGDNAEVVSINGPAEVSPNAPVNINITLKNTGSTVWEGSAGYRLGDGNGGPYRTFLNSASVQPGQNGTFTVGLTAPSQPGEYYAVYQMLQEGVNWFGNKAGFQYIVKGPVVQTTVTPNPVLAPPIQVINPTPSEGIFSEVTDFFGQQSVQIAGYNVPTIYLLGGVAVIGLYMMTKGRH